MAVSIAMFAACEYGEIVVQDSGADASRSLDAATNDAASADSSADTHDAAGNDAAADGDVVDDDGGQAAERDRVVQIGSGLTHSCVRFESGRIKCWGGNDRGQLGLGDTKSRGDQPKQMGDALPYVQLGKGRRAKSLAVGRKFNCVLLDDDTVKCWGYNQVGMLGIGSACLSACGGFEVVDNRGDEPNEMGDQLPVVDLGTQHHAIGLVAGSEGACALMDDQSVRCWGSNDSGALGNSGGCNGSCISDRRGDAPGEMGNLIPVVSFGAGLKVAQLSMGWDFVLALLTDGTIKAWGQNNLGQLGLGDGLNRGDDPNEMGDQLSRVLLPAGKKATQIFAGAAHACARLNDGTLHCWGNNEYAQLGVGDTTSRCDSEGSQPCTALVEVLPSNTRASVALGEHHSCAIRNQGDVRCWGSNAQGELGVGDTAMRGDVPGELMGQVASAELPQGHTYVAVTAGSSFSCALTDNGGVRCWGGNALGQLGLGDPRVRGTLPDGVEGSIDVDLGSQ